MTKNASAPLLTRVTLTREAVRSDTELLELSAAGDETAWAELMDRYLRLVWSIPIGIGLSRADAADVVQFTWTALFTALPQIREPEQVRYWLCTTARRESHACLRRAQRTVSLGSPDSILDLDETAAGPEEHVIRFSGDTVLTEVFQQLSEGCRKLLTMLISDQPATYEQVAQEFAISKGTIGAKRRRCLDHLRDLYVAGTNNHKELRRNG